eukprot:CAMPEP_0196593952 /NCGR_PEP_ID=MMETSP1081-20130531/76998_1 /TAXON_ID=36882 /ORGANISM="Pyramimonas amylifera, Strain CCMP720" /LENGTH=181 /DNA_ID=CAMNT_0041918079 /DNA_START=95 /DNA_END=637 /DNA_ORIENTATION=+
MSQLSAIDLAAIGAFAGVVEVSLQQPTVTAKNYLQQGKAVPLSPSILYRGWLINSASIAPICCIQFGTNRFLELTLNTYNVTKDTGTTLGCAALAGVAGSFVSTPSEMLMLHQQLSKTPSSLVGTARNLISEHGASILYRGQVPCIFREAMWAGAYLGLVPVFEGHLAQTEALASSPYSVW